LFRGEKRASVVLLERKGEGGNSSFVLGRKLDEKEEGGEKTPDLQFRVRKGREKGKNFRC